MTDIQNFILHSLTPENKEKFSIWLCKAEKAVAEAQGSDVPYHGAIGGAVAFVISPTGLGEVITASYAGYKEKIDLTDYDMW